MKIWKLVLLILCIFIFRLIYISLRDKELLLQNEIVIALISGLAIYIVRQVWKRSIKTEQN